MTSVLSTSSCRTVARSQSELISVVEATDSGAVGRRFSLPQARVVRFPEAAFWVDDFVIASFTAVHFIEIPLATCFFLAPAAEGIREREEW
jgi:hypothetical protein